MRRFETKSKTLLKSIDFGKLWVYNILVTVLTGLVTTTEYALPKTVLRDVPSTHRKAVFTLTKRNFEYDYIRFVVLDWKPIKRTRLVFRAACIYVHC